MSARLLPVHFVHMCCTGGRDASVAGQSESGAIYFRRVNWLSDRPWLYMPPPLEPATKRRSASVTTNRRRVAPRR